MSMIRSTAKPAKSATNLICEAIRKRSLLEFSYHDQLRVVAPYCHGTSARNEELLRGIQVRGASASGGLGFGKLWKISDMLGLRILDETFKANDPNYNPQDSAMAHIHCCV